MCIYAYLCIVREKEREREATETIDGRSNDQDTNYRNTERREEEKKELKSRRNKAEIDGKKTNSVEMYKCVGKKGSGGGGGATVEG